MLEEMLAEYPLYYYAYYWIKNIKRDLNFHDGEAE